MLTRLPKDSHLASGILLVIVTNLILGFPQVLGQDLGAIDVVALLRAICVGG